MGVFNWVNVKIPCPACGNNKKTFTASWQTKECDIELSCDIVELSAVREMHNFCHDCKAYIIYERKPEKKKITLDDFNRTIKHSHRPLTLEDE